MALVGILAFFLFNNHVYAQELNITSDMSQEEIDKVLENATSQDNIVIASGDYSTVKDNKNYHKIITVQKENLSFNIAGDYTELQFIIRANNVKITANDATIDGNANTEGNPGAALFVETGSVTLNGTPHTNISELATDNCSGLLEYVDWINELISSMMPGLGN